MKTFPSDATPFEIARQIVQGAERHGDDSGEADMTIGDLEIVLTAAIEEQSLEQRGRFLARDDVQGVLAGGMER